MLQGNNPACPAVRNTLAKMSDFCYFAKGIPHSHENPPAYADPHKVHEGNYI
jgi:hypothetical protein